MSRNHIPTQRGTRDSTLRDLDRLCHDLRQCLSAGLLLAGMPSREDLDTATERRFELLRQTLTHATALVERMHEDPLPRQRPLDLAELTERCVAVAEVGHRLGYTCETWQTPVVLGDPVMIRRAVDNLVDNAVRAAGELGSIRVLVGSDLVDAWVEVTDDGPGFGQIEHGTGKGLSVVTSAVRASGGHLSIISGPGPGTTIRLSFPRCDTYPPAEGHSAEPSAYSSNDAFQSPYPL